MVLSQVDGLIEFGNGFGNQGLKSVEPPLLVGAIPCQLTEILYFLLYRCNCNAIRFQLRLVSGEEVITLPNLSSHESVGHIVEFFKNLQAMFHPPNFLNEVGYGPV